MKDRKLAARYARALLSTLTDPADAAKADAFLTGIADAIEASPAFHRFLHDPSFSRDDRRSVLLQLAEQKGQPVHVANFLAILVNHQRLGVLPSIARVFHEEREAAEGIVPAEITTAEPMSDEMRDRARAALTRLTGREVRLDCKVDPAVLGGAVTRIGSTVYDGSLRTQLQQLRRDMIQE